MKLLRLERRQPGLERLAGAMTSTFSTGTAFCDYVDQRYKRNSGPLVAEPGFITFSVPHG
jgi:hypothetical protein